MNTGAVRQANAQNYPKQSIQFTVGDMKDAMMATLAFSCLAIAI